MKSALALLNTMVEFDVLGTLPREGWFFAGIDAPESVSDHSFQTTILSFFIAKSLNETVDLNKILLMSLFHDVAECRLTDLPRRATKYLLNSKIEAEDKIIADLFANVGGDVGGDIEALFKEFTEVSTLEAKIVLAAHDLQNLIKAFIYAETNRGNMTEYLEDAKCYNDRGISIARDICDIIISKLSSKFQIL